MPNWVAGTFKIRGTQKNIISCLNDLFVNDDCTVEPLREGSDLLVIKGNPKIRGYHMNGIRGAMIDYGGDYLVDVDDCDTEGEIIVELDKFRQAWVINADDFKEVSLKNNVDFKIYGYEAGNKFEQEVEIIKGEVTENNNYGYENYDWECPFSKLGG